MRDHHGHDGDLEVVADSLMGAAGGIDSIMAAVADGAFGDFQVFDVLDERVDIGDVDLGLALSAFSARWMDGLGSLVADQRQVAGGLRSCVDTFFGCDHDVADAFRVAHGGVFGGDHHVGGHPGGPPDHHTPGPHDHHTDHHRRRG